jgi:AmmeMemoRadiSam system protein B
VSDRLVRSPAAAGRFYPADADVLRDWVVGALDRAAGRATESERTSRPRAIVAPHAGYVYSGDVAATAYATMMSGGVPVERVVLLGPAHMAPVATLAASSAEAFATPLGPAATDTELRDALVATGLVAIDDRAHRPEHSLEVQLPFVQVLLGDVPVLPILTGPDASSSVDGVLEHVWGDPATLLVVSTDLSHYHDYRTARQLDEATASAVIRGRADLLDPWSACGVSALRGLVALAAGRDLVVRLLDLRNSGDTAGPRDRVVGYGAFAVG